MATPLAQIRMGRDVTESVIVLGNHNTISLTRNGTLAFQFLSEDFRRQQAERPGTPFYDGAMPQWANIPVARMRNASCMRRSWPSSRPTTCLQKRSDRRPGWRGQDHPSAPPGLVTG